MPRSFDALANVASLAVVFNKLTHARPEVSPLDILESSGKAEMTSKRVIVMLSKNLEFENLRYVDLFAIVEESRIWLHRPSIKNALKNGFLAWVQFRLTNAPCERIFFGSSFKLQSGTL